MTTEIMTSTGVDSALHTRWGAEGRGANNVQMPTGNTHNKAGEWKETSGQSKDGKWQGTLGVREAAGPGVTESAHRVSSWQPHNAGAAGTHSLVFQKKRRILTFNVTFLISGSICCNIIALNRSLGVFWLLGFLFMEPLM